MPACPWANDQTSIAKVIDDFHSPRVEFGGVNNRIKPTFSLRFLKM